MAYQNNYFGANLVVPDLVYSCRFLPVISSHFPGGFTCTLLDSGYHHVCCCLIIEEKSIVWSSSWGVFFPNAPPFTEPSFTPFISEIIISRISKEDKIDVENFCAVLEYLVWFVTTYHSIKLIIMANFIITGRIDHILWWHNMHQQKIIYPDGGHFCMSETL